MDSGLKGVFDSYTANSGQMDGKTFAKLAKDTKLIDKKLTATDIDLIFAKSKTSAERKITFQQFQGALKLCAEKKGTDLATVAGQVAS